MGGGSSTTCSGRAATFWRPRITRRSSARSGVTSTGWRTRSIRTSMKSPTWSAGSKRQEKAMPDKTTIERARKDRRQGKAPTTQAGEFVREEIEKIRRGEHGARSPEQAIAIGLSKARRAGVPLRSEEHTSELQSLRHL